MAKQARIVDFEEARSSSYRRAAQRKAVGESARSGSSYGGTGYGSTGYGRTGSRRSSRSLSDKNTRSARSKSTSLSASKTSSRQTGNQVAKQSNRQASKQVARQTSRQTASKQRTKPAAKQTRSQTTRQAPTQTRKQSAMQRAKKTTRSQTRKRARSNMWSVTQQTWEMPAFEKPTWLDNAQNRIVAKVEASKLPEKTTAFFARLGQRKTIALVVCSCLVVTLALLYMPAKHYYTAVRDQAKAEIAYEIVSTRNDALEQDVALLSSETGIEDRVREQYGWVKQGENAVMVTGLEDGTVPSAAEILRTVTLNDVRAPETWYSPFLDSVFGYVP